MQDYSKLSLLLIIIKSIQQCLMRFFRETITKASKAENNSLHANDQSRIRFNKKEFITSSQKRLDSALLFSCWDLLLGAGQEDGLAPLSGLGCSGESRTWGDFCSLEGSLWVCKSWRRSLRPPMARGLPVTHLVDGFALFSPPVPREQGAGSSSGESGARGRGTGWNPVPAGKSSGFPGSYQHPSHLCGQTGAWCACELGCALFRSHPRKAVFRGAGRDRW